MDLIATKALTYATRRLQAGDTFQAPNRDGRLLCAIRKAKPAPAPDPAEEELKTLRVVAEGLGIEVDGRWGAKRIRAEIAQAREG